MKKYKCSLCGFVTMSRKKMRKHLKEVHHLKGRSKGDPRHGFSPFTHAMEVIG